MVPEFYKDCEIFFTGGSGIIGKATIEKLLRSTDVKKIYILLRSKKGASVEQRLEKIKNEKIFRVLKTERPDALNKLVAIPGDTALPNLGLTPFYAKELENVSCFFHCAATVRFNEVLFKAVNVNVGGTWEALKLAETLKKLKIFVHVSTFYSNPYLEYVESKLYSAPMDWKLCLEMIKNGYNEEAIDTLTEKLIVGYFNTYCFSKNLAESVVNDYRHRLPVLIFRPSIVITAMFEPEPGYPPSLIGAIGVFASAGAGLMKVFHSRYDLLLDMIPQDFCTTTMLTSAFLTAKKYEDGIVVELPVTPCSSYDLLAFTVKEVDRIMKQENIYYDLAFDKSLLLPGFKCTESKCLYKMMCFTHQFLPALLCDALLVLFGRKPVMMSVARKQYLMLEILKPFFFKTSKSDMVKKLPKLMEVSKGSPFDLSPYEKAMLSQKEVTEFLRNSMYKIREVLLNEDPSTLPRARRVLKVKLILYNIIRGYLLYYILLWLYGVFLNNI